MALSSASRASAIYQLDVRYMLRPEEKFVFPSHKFHKSWKYWKVCSEDISGGQIKTLPITVELHLAICGRV